MELLNAIILGILQGLTEFLPVSSSGHLEIMKVILGDKNIGQDSMMMTVVLHFATALATIVVFRKELLELGNGLFQFKNNESFRFSLNIVLSMIPATFVGVFFNEEIESLFGGKLTLVGGMLIITGFLLFLANKAKESKKKIGMKAALLIGIAQAVAILPGISRSGATISISVILGIDKEKSARFSFLMVVPLIFGKMTKDLLSNEISTSDTHLLSLIVGFLFAFFSGMIACRWMIKFVKNSQLKYFAYYCFSVGIIVMGVSLL